MFMKKIKSLLLLLVLPALCRTVLPATAKTGHAIKGTIANAANLQV
jgi:hypothetical protein